MTTEAEEVGGLDRVLTRLALTEDQNLEKVLQKLIPAVVRSLKSPYEGTRKKVLEILSHVNKRVKGQNGLQLPLDESLAIFIDSTSAPMVKNFALVYAEMAFNRAPANQKFATLPQLLLSLSARPASHQAICMRMVLGAAEAHSCPAAPSPASAEQYTFMNVPQDRQLFLHHARQYLMYHPQLVLRNKPPAPGADVEMTDAAGAAQPAAGPPLAPPATCPGLSAAQVKALEEKGVPSLEVVGRTKMGLLALLAGLPFSGSELMLPLMAAACDSIDQVARRGEELLRRLVSLDSTKPSVDLESQPLVDELFSVFHGSTDKLGGALPPEAQRLAPASAALRAKLLSALQRSTTAARTFPASLVTIEDSVYGPRSNARVKQGGREFAVWVFKHAEVHQLRAMGPLVVKGLLSSLDDSDAAAQDAASLSSRGFAYQALGSLAQRVPALFSDSPDVARRFFRALAEEPPGVRATVQEAVSCLGQSFKGAQGEAAGHICGLLLESVASSKDAVRSAAVQWASRLFPLNHIPTRYVLVVAAGDVKNEVREEALRGLGLHTAHATTATTMTADTTAKLAPPNLVSLLAEMRRRVAVLKLLPDQARALPLPPKSFLALIQLLQKSWKEGGPEALLPEGPGESDPDLVSPAPGVPPLAYTLVLEHALVRDATHELVVAALGAMMALAAAAPSHWADRAVTRLTWLRSFLQHPDAVARATAAKLMGIAAGSLSCSAAEQLVVELLEVAGSPTAATDMQVDKPPGSPAAASSPAAAAAASSNKASTRFEEREGALLATGYVVAQCRTAQPDLPPQLMTAALSALYRAMCAAQQPLLAAAAASAVGFIGLRGPLPLDDTYSPPPTPMIEGDSNSTETKAANGDLTDGVGADGVPSMGAMVTKLLALTEDRDVKVVVRAVTAAGHVCHGSDEPRLSSKVLDRLLAMGTNKSEEVQFAAGEALSFVFGGVPVTADTMLRTDYTSLSTCFNILKATDDDEPVAMAVDEDQPSTSSADDSRRGPGQQRVLDHILGGSGADSSNSAITNSRAEVRCAAAVWLISLLTYTGRHPVLVALLAQIQDAFCQLLGDSNDLTQEMASRGVSLVYRLGDKATRATLVQSLVGVLQGGPKAKQAVKLSGDTKVFEEGALGTAPPTGSAASRSGGAASTSAASSSSSSSSSSLSTYKELCALATDLGQPDLIYRFMDLAHHAQALASRRGAAFGFAGIAKLAGSDLAPHIATLVPKLYRYMYDPNPRVADAMTHIWRQLVDDPRTTVDTHYDAIMKDLLKEMGGRLWRNRQAAAAATADLLQGRKWSSVKPYLADIWVMMMRALDDIKESVRQAAAGLARTTKGLTLRLADPQYTSAAECAEVVGCVMPLLLDKGLSSTVVEVRSLALDTLAKMAKGAGVSSLSSQLVPLVAAGLEALSSLEDVRLNYLEQHAQNMGLEQDRLEAVRVAASRSSPMQDVLDMAGRAAGPEHMDALTGTLTGFIRSGVGLNTKVGTARFIRSLVQRLGRSMRTQSTTLMRALFNGVRAERSGAVRRAYAGAAAALAAVAPQRAVDDLVNESVGLVTGSDASDKDQRLAGGLFLRELVRVSPELFQGCAATVLPVAFGAKMDEDADVAAVWKDVWEEGASSEAAAIRLYLVEVVAVLVAGLTAGQWGRKKAAAQALSQLAQVAGAGLSPHAELLCVTLMGEMGGRLWDGKEEVIRALAAVGSTVPGAVRAAPGTDRVVSALMTAVGRKRQSYRTAALAALSEVLPALNQDLYVQVSPLLIEALSTHCTAPPPAAPAADGTPGGGDEEVEKPLPAQECLKVLAAAWKVAGPDTVKAEASKLSTTLATVLQANLPWQTRLAAVSAASHFIAHVTQASCSCSAAEGVSWLAPLLPALACCLEQVQQTQMRQSVCEALEALLKGCLERHWNRELALGAAEGLQAVSRQVAELGGSDSTAAAPVKSAALRVTGLLQQLQG